MKVLITGGAGYIGSTIGSALLDRGITPVVLDNLTTGSAEFTRGRTFYRGDIADPALLDRVFAEHPDIHATVHCAALTVVPESVAHPLRCYEENVAKSVELLRNLIRNGCGRLLFSSSASIYQPGEDFSVDETSPVRPTSPYARSKAMIEQVLADAAAGGEVTALSLRYFNPVGADPRLRSGCQQPNPSHVLGKLISAWERGGTFQLTGVDWPTPDGTGIRDYIHVWDLARAHVHALLRFDEAVSASQEPGYQVVNLGTGRPTTVRELVRTFTAVAGTPLATEEVAARPGDTVGAYTRTERARRLLGWRCEHTLADAIRDALRWRARWHGRHNPRAGQPLLAEAVSPAGEAP
ncbi:UDP-glucose 4-epimerase GalE [Goodfellowiella coeruleoviolacea]|uniref:UDP-glucose 4-epimerase n=1 Tax=Goodfellowiella coeruleoviolacea TaxID=334858 RepID=A0AAE3G9R2_9PSEU|nr:UDP-glucose 4-epimerase GalE [Goodfellowiella coeruleoviolacea]MCP2164266.1 UDP-glucose 4-epimerase [Goodfellowiella coeruleoviolacea]